MEAEQHMPPYIALAILNPYKISWTNFEKDNTECLPAKEQHPPFESDAATISLLTDRTSSTQLKLRYWFNCIVQYLLILSIFSPSLAFTSFTATVENYYQVNAMLVCCLNLVYAIVPAILIPVIYYFALQYDATLLAFFCSLINTVGAGIRCKGTDRDGFFLLLLGQSFTSASAAFYPFLLLPLNGSTCRHNFLSEEFLYLSSCTASFFGVSIGNLLPLQFINVKDSTSETSSYIFKYTLGSAGFAASVLILLPFTLKETVSRNIRPFYKSTNDIVNRPLNMPYAGISNLSLLRQYIHCFKGKKRQIGAHAHTFAVSFGLCWVLLLHFQNVLGTAAKDESRYVGFIGFISIILGTCSAFVILKVKPKSLKWCSFTSLLFSAVCTVGFILCASQKFPKMSFSLFAISVISTLVHLTVSTLQMVEDSLPASRKCFIILSLHLGFTYSSLFGIIGTVLLWKLGLTSFAIFTGAIYVATLSMTLIRIASQGDRAFT